jgi:hypothetical protein
MLYGAVDLPERRRPGEARDGLEDDDSDNDGLDYDDPSSRMRSAATFTNARSEKNIRGPSKNADDSDSDFEFDM